MEKLITFAVAVLKLPETIAEESFMGIHYNSKTRLPNQSLNHSKAESVFLRGPLRCLCLQMEIGIGKDGSGTGMYGSGLRSYKFLT